MLDIKQYNGIESTYVKQVLRGRKIFVKLEHHIREEAEEQPTQTTSSFSLRKMPRFHEPDPSERSTLYQVLVERQAENFG